MRAYEDPRWLALKEIACAPKAPEETALERHIRSKDAIEAMYEIEKEYEGMSPLEIIDLAVRDKADVIIRARDRVTFQCTPLHVGSRTVWCVAGNADVFIPTTEILSAERVPNALEGNPE